MVTVAPERGCARTVYFSGAKSWVGTRLVSAGDNGIATTATLAGAAASARCHGGGFSGKFTSGGLDACVVSGGLGLFLHGPQATSKACPQPPWLLIPSPQHTAGSQEGTGEREGSWPPALALDQASGTEGQCRSGEGVEERSRWLLPSWQSSHRVLRHASTPVPRVTEVQVGQSFGNWSP